jgi:arginase
MADRAVAVLCVPYDSGHHRARMGRGPQHLLDHRLADRIGDGISVGVSTIRHELPFPTENAAAFALHGRVADSVRRSRTEGKFPLILSGNCNLAAIGAVAGLGAEGTGVLWFDAHGDCETPETSTSAFLDGMALAMLAGACWTRRLAEVPGFAPVPGDRVALIGARDLSAEEEALVLARRIGRVSVDEVRRDGAAALGPALTGLVARGVRRLYVHVDADVHDPAEAGSANHYSASAGAGLHAAEVRACLAAAASVFPVQAAAITAYDPDADRGGRMRATLLTLAADLARLGTT